MRKSWLEEEVLWVSVIGLPHNHWSERNAEILGRVLGERMLEVENGRLELIRLDLFKIKIRLRGSYRDWGPLMVTDGKYLFGFCLTRTSTR